MATADRSEPSDTHSDATPLEALEELLRLLAAAKSPADSSNPPAVSSGLAYGQALQSLVQVMLAWAASGLRSWARMTELLGASLPLIVDSLAEAAGRSPQRDPAEQARRLDELRVSLRELMELPGRESQRLRTEIERILLGGGRDAPSPRAPGPDAHWRRWEPKP